MLKDLVVISHLTLTPEGAAKAPLMVGGQMQVSDPHYELQGYIKYRGVKPTCENRTVTDFHCKHRKSPVAKNQACQAYLLCRGFHWH